MTPNSIITLPPETLTPWEKRDDESVKAYSAFCVYRDSPISNRSQRATCIGFYGEVTSGKTRTIEAWSAKFDWVRRAQAWDLYKEQESRKMQIESIAKMNERHNGIADKMLTLAVNRLNELMNTDDTDDRLTPADLVAIINSATKLERTSRGQPSEIIEERGKNINFNIEAGGNSDVMDTEAYKLTPDQLREAYGKLLSAKRAMNNDDGN